MEKEKVLVGKEHSMRRKFYYRNQFILSGKFHYKKKVLLAGKQANWPNWANQ